MDINKFKLYYQKKINTHQIILKKYINFITKTGEPDEFIDMAETKIEKVCEYYPTELYLFNPLRKELQHIEQSMLRFIQRYNLSEICVSLSGGVDSMVTLSILKFLKGDITNETYINQLFKSYQFDGVIHLAALSNVSQSLLNPNNYYK